MIKTWKKIMIAGTAAALAVLLVPVSAIASAKDDVNRLVPGTVINGIPVSGMTPQDAKSYMEGFFNGNYTLKLRDKNGNKETIRDTDIGLEMQVTGDISAVLTDQNARGRENGPGIDNKYQVDAKMVYDEERLDAILFELSCVKNGTPTTDAYISAYEEGKDFSIIPEVQGTEIDMDRLKDAVRTALDNRKSLVSLADTGCYKQVSVKSDNEELNLLCSNMNRFKDVTITYTFGDQKELLAGTEIAKWINGGNGTGMAIDEQKAAAYIKSLADKYDTYGKPHVYKSTSGREVTINGNYGWQINQQEELVALKNMINNCSSQTREPAYSQTAASRNGYDFGNTYVEIDMGEQKLYMYKDGECIVNTPIVTGNVSKNYTTPEGLYTLYYKERNRILRGPKLADGSYSYESPVSYWMPFNGGIGLHDATWRGKFGGTIYKTNGSHGCINMPLNAAKTVYENVYKNIPILCFY